MSSNSNSRLFGPAGESRLRSGQSVVVDTAAVCHLFGPAGESRLRSVLEMFGWGPVPNEKHDSGTDFFCPGWEPDLFDGQAVLGVQVKTGASYFRSPLKEMTKPITRFIGSGLA